MTDEYTARERALTLAHKDADSQTSVEWIVEVAEKYLAFLWLQPAENGVVTLQDRIDRVRRDLKYLEDAGVSDQAQNAEDDAPLGEFITQDSINIWKRTNNVLAQLQDGGIAG